MEYVKGILSGAAGILLALILPSLLVIFRGITDEKATGFAIVFGGLTESLYSFRFWMLAILFCLVFFAASRLQNKLLRVFLFWTPTVVIAAIGMGFAALFNSHPSS